MASENKLKTFLFEGVPADRAAIDRRVFVKLAAGAGASLLATGLLGGCSSPSAEDETEPAPTSSSESVPQQEAPASEASKTLVAVFSWSGNTLQVAERINHLVESDLFRIEPAESYTQDYNELLDVAQAEQDADARPALAATVENWDDYGVVYLGYPVWWYEAPQIIKTFVEAHDFSDKVVYPFATSGGSGISGTLPEIQELCPEAEFREGITLDGDSVGSQLDRIDEWLGEGGLR